MDFKQLDYFICIAETGSMSAAAKSFYLTPQAMGKQMRAFEKELGFPLFEKTNRGVTLTKSGAMFLERAREMNAIAHEAIDEGRRLSGKKPPHLSIGCYRNANLFFLPKVVEDFRRIHPEVEFSFIDMASYDEIDALLRDGSVHVTMTIGNEHASKPGITYICIAHEHVQLTVETSDVLAKENFATVEDLRGRVLCTSVPGFSKWNDMMREYLSHREPEVETIESGMNEAGLMILRMPGVVGIGIPMVMPPECSDRVCIPFIAPAGIPETMSIDIATSRPEDPLVREFVKIAKQTCKALP